MELIHDIMIPSSKDLFLIYEKINTYSVCECVYRMIRKYIFPLYCIQKQEYIKTDDVGKGEIVDDDYFLT